MSTGLLLTLLVGVLAVLAWDAWRRQTRRAVALDRLDRSVGQVAPFQPSRRQWRVIWVTLSVAGFCWLLASADYYLAIGRAQRSPFFTDLTLVIVVVGLLRCWQLRES